MFKRKKPTLTNESYGRWLRAQRPPLEMFLAQTDEEQEALASIGDTYIENLAIALGYAIADPEAAEAGLDAGDNTEAEGVLLQKVLHRALAQHIPAAPPPPTLAGAPGRRAKAEAERKRQRCNDVASTATFLGRPPDEVVAK